MWNLYHGRFGGSSGIGLLKLFRTVNFLRRPILFVLFRAFEKRSSYILLSSRYASLPCMSLQTGRLCIPQ